MKSFVFLAILTLCLSAVFAEDGDVVVLTDSNFDEFIGSHEYVLVEFYAPWCGHCKHLAPEYEKAATAVKSKGIALAKVDATVETNIAAKFEIRGYPTLFFFRNGNKKEYNGPRQAEGIAEWVIKRSGPLVSSLADADAVEAFTNDRAVSVVVYVSNPSESLASVEAIASRGELDTFAFAIAPHLDTITKDTVRLHRSFDDDIDFDGSLSDVSGIVSFIIDNGYPLVEPVQISWQRLRAKGLPIGLLALSADESDPSVQSAIQLVVALAKANKGKFSFASLGPRFLQNVKEMGVTGNRLPSMVILDSSDNKYAYPDASEFTEEALQEWLNQIKDGKLAPYFKSEEIPENNDGPVTVVVGKSFEQIVLDPTRDVLVEFYAPWCGHCKTLAPTYEELGKHFENNDKIVIAKVDSTANDNPSVQIRGFPTLYFFPSGNKGSPVEYQGGRDLESLISFVNEHASPGFVTDSHDDDDDDEHSHKDL